MIGILQQHPRVMASNLLLSLLLVAMPYVPSSLLFLVVRPGATSSVLVPTSDGLHLSATLFDFTTTEIQVVRSSGQATQIP